MSWYSTLLKTGEALFSQGPLAEVKDELLAEYYQTKIFLKIKKPPWWFRLYLKFFFKKWQTAFFAPLFSMLGKMARADGPVTPRELAAVEAFIDKQLVLHIDQKTMALRIFTQAGQTESSFESFARQYFETFGQSRAMLKLALDALLGVAYADDRYAVPEKRYVKAALEIFGISSRDYARLKAAHIALKQLQAKHAVKERWEELSERWQGLRGPRFNFREAAVRAAAAASPLERYYQVLGCTGSDSLQTVKRRYRKLVLKHHPDRAAPGLPPDVIESSTKRFREIQEAYDAIVKAQTEG